VHYMLTGVNAIGIGDASGMFPINSQTHNYDEEMLSKFDYLIAEKKYPWKIKDLLPKVLVAGEDAGCLTDEGEIRIDHLLPTGTHFAPAEGDAGTGMTATNAVAPRTGNISAGTSIFSMVVLENPLKKVYPEVDVVTTPTGEPVAMVHCNNCTNDMNAWISVLQEAAELFGAHPSTNEIYTKLYNQSLEGSTDCGGLTVYNYMAGESVTHLNEGRPLVARKPDSDFSLANFMRAQLYSSIATLKTGMDILFGENVCIDSLTGHGGLFKTPEVGQKYLAAACNTPITVLETAGEGGPYGMALLAAYCSHHGNISLNHFLESEVFLHTRKITLIPSMNDVKGFNEYHKRFTAGLTVEQEAVKNL
jgi:sugar (pentulose or hexulose) kinase